MIAQETLTIIELLKNVMTSHATMLVIGIFLFVYLIFITLILTDTYPEKLISDDYKE
jgi:hypothetical protein